MRLMAILMESPAVDYAGRENNYEWLAVVSLSSLKFASEERKREERHISVHLTGERGYAPKDCSPFIVRNRIC
jgi:hypothetical protein